MAMEIISKKVKLYDLLSPSLRSLVGLLEKHSQVILLHSDTFAPKYRFLALGFGLLHHQYSLLEERTRLSPTLFQFDMSPPYTAKKHSLDFWCSL